VSITAISLPVSVRDTAGRVVGIFADPLDYILPDVTAASGGLDVVDTRADLMPTTDLLEKTSPDYYAALRSVMAQRRAALVEEGKSGGQDAEPTSAVPSAPTAAAEPRAE